MTGPQASDGYKCTCGTILETKKEFSSHLLHSNQGEEKGQHHSAGRVNLETGEVTMPPWAGRTPEQKALTQHSTKKERKERKEQPHTEAIRPTEIIAQATQLKAIPRVYTFDYSPVMRAAQDAVIFLWGWPEMGLGDLIDTIFHMFFESKGVKLASFTIDETEEEREEREAAVSKIIAEREQEVTSDS